MTRPVDGMARGSETVAWPLVTMWPQHDQEEINAVRRVLGAGKTNYHTGSEGTAFEEEWSRAVGVTHSFTCSNGTTALEMCLRGVGLLWHDSVIVPARTFIATAAAVVNCGGVPVLADIVAGSLCVTVDTLKAARLPNTSGVIVVHWGGLPVPGIADIAAWCKAEGLFLIEDCAHAHGAPGVGAYGDAAAWSFCVGKIMSTGGEGGMVCAPRNAVADQMRAWRDHGRYQMTGGRDMSGAGVGNDEFLYTVEDFGSNLRMTEIQAAIGRVQLKGLQRQLERRREIAARYDEVLGWRAMYTPEQRATHSRYLYTVRAAGKRGVMRSLSERGIPVQFGGCPNIGKEPAFAKRGWVYHCPVADRVGTEVFSIPVYPTMTDADVTRVCRALKECV